MDSPQLLGVTGGDSFGAHQLLFVLTQQAAVRISQEEQGEGHMTHLGDVKIIVPANSGSGADKGQRFV